MEVLAGAAALTALSLYLSPANGGKEKPATTAQLMWSPPKDKETEIDKFRKAVNAKYKLDLKDYYDLHAWSVKYYDSFWEECYLQLGVKASQSYSKVVDKSVAMSDIPEWFAGCRMNFAENLLSRNDDTDAIIFNGEMQEERRITYAQLSTEVAKVASGLRALGVVKGDRVVGYLSNCIEAIVAMLATTSIGAIWSSTSPDFGVTGVLDRFTQIQPKVIFTINAYYYKQKTHDHHEKVREVCAGLKELEKVILIKFAKDAPVDTTIPKSVTYESFVSSAEDRPLVFEQLPFNHPIYIMFSSGTTGKPKCIVHSAGGTLLQHKKELILHGDLQAGEKLFYFTTTGWMMWNWLVSGLAVGAAVCLYDGLPDPTSMFDLVDSVGINVFGTSAKFLGVCEQVGLKPRESHRLSTLRAVLSTGSPLHPPQYDYVYGDIKGDVLLGSITGGTDIISCFAGSNPALPVYRGEIQHANLGMDVHSYDCTTKMAAWDNDGDLVCITPFPSMPVFFWDDKDHAKYRAAYFQSPYTHNGKAVWCHGDFVEIRKSTGGLFMLGRSDGVLNPSGVRFGSAELYNVLRDIETMEDCVAVGQHWKGDERVVLFVKTKDSPGSPLAPELVAEIKKLVRAKLSPRHVPAVILPVADVPYTLSGKKVELAIKRIVSGGKATNAAALKNPSSLDLYANRPELKE